MVVARWIGLAVVALAIFVGGRYSVGERSVTVSVTDTVRVSETEILRDTVTQTVPREVRITDTVEVSRIDTILVPVPDLTPDDPDGDPFRPHGLITSSPIDISGRDVTLSYWHVSSRSWRQNVYEVPPKSPNDWGLYLDAGVEAAGDLAPAVTGTLSAIDVQALARGGLRHRRIRTEIGAGFRGARPVATVGIRYRLIDWTW